MDDKIEILAADLVRKHPDKLALIDYWKRVLNIPNGWHYDLDIIWILNSLEEAGVKKGALIIDAGAGNGLLQFLLASKGYNVLSLDFAERDFPALAPRIFRMFAEDRNVSKDHRYQKFMSYKKHRISPAMFLKAFKMPRLALDVAAGRLRQFASPKTWKEILKGHGGYGNITYVKCDFRALKGFADKTVDCVVSVSALEHNDHPDIKKSVKELERVLKPGSAMFVTVSAARDKDWYFEACRGWCFTYDTLCDLFDIRGAASNYEKYDELFKRLEKSEAIKERVAKAYFRSGDNGLPWGVYKPLYQPVGIIKKKTSK